VAVRFIRSAFEGIKSIYTNKDPAIRRLVKYTKITDGKILEESYRFSLDALSNEGSMVPKSLSAQPVSQNSIGEAASKNCR